MVAENVIRHPILDHIIQYVLLIIVHKAGHEIAACYWVKCDSIGAQLVGFVGGRCPLRFTIWYSYCEGEASGALVRISSHALSFGINRQSI